MSFLETERLLIRTWMPRDAPAAAAIYGNPEVMRFVGDGIAYSPERSLAVMQQHIADEEREGFGVWPVVLKESGEIAGECGLQRLANARDIELSYLFAREHWGHGYAFEAASTVLEFGLSQLRLPRIVAVCDRENARSIALINRLDMRYEGISRVYKRDLLRYSLRG